MTVLWRIRALVGGKGTRSWGNMSVVDWPISPASNDVIVESRTNGR